MLLQRQTDFSVQTKEQGFTNISNQLTNWLADIGAGEGLLTVFIRHTSASLTIQENADPNVLADLGDSLRALALESARYRHDNEGPDDMPAHIKSMLTATSISIPVQDGAPVFGTWQSLFLIEHRSRPHMRQIVLHYFGELSGQ